MGLLDSALGTVVSHLANGERQNNLLGSVIDLINRPETGGLAGLVQHFSDNGLGNEIASWISTGENLPITGQQLQAILGSPQIQEIATKFGLSSDVVSSELASLLPKVIDGLTPNGALPAGGLLEQGLELLRKNFG